MDSTMFITRTCMIYQFLIYPTTFSHLNWLVSHPWEGLDISSPISQGAQTKVCVFFIVLLY